MRSLSFEGSGYVESDAVLLDEYLPVFGRTVVPFYLQALEVQEE
jgi:hypothetical protein